VTTPLAPAAPIIERFADLEALSRAAMAAVLQHGAEAITARGRFDLALSGGSTPRRLLRLLAEAGPRALPWQRVHWWWCDERTVPPDHPDSNFGMAQRALAPLQLEPSHLHRIAGEFPDPESAAAAYQRELCGALGSPPALDLALLGLGSDGHTASLFPHSQALRATAWVVANPVTSPLAGGTTTTTTTTTTRITLTAPTLHAARAALMLVAGADKAAALAAVLRGPADAQRYPAQLLAAGPRPMRWLIDETAASQLETGDFA
jgi:6-phosphogluconolactonase